MASSLNSSGSVGSRLRLNVKCHHNVDARARVVSNGGANTGKRFYGCGRYPVENCNFFKWEEDVIQSSMDAAVDEMDQKMKDKQDVIEELVVTNYGMEEKLKRNKLKKMKLEQQLDELKVIASAHAKGEKNALIALAISWLFFAYYLIFSK